MFSAAALNTPTKKIGIFWKDHSGLISSKFTEEQKIHKINIEGRSYKCVFQIASIRELQDKN